MVCDTEVREFIEAVDRLWKLGVNPRRALRELAWMAEADDPRFAEAFKAYIRYRAARRDLMRCALRAFEEQHGG